MTNKIYNQLNKKSLRKELRSNAPAPEKILWNKIRCNQLGIKFRRQYGIGRYIADFYSPQIKLLIELDGDSHYQEGSQEYDAVRDQFMHSLGIVVLRFRNDEVMRELNAVIGKIVDVIEDLSPLPSPPLGKGRG